MLLTVAVGCLVALSVGEVSWAVPEATPQSADEQPDSPDDASSRAEVDQVDEGEFDDRPVFEVEQPTEAMDRVSEALPDGVGAVAEVEELRTEFSQTFATDEAEVLVTEWSETPVHFEDDEGEWVQIDETLELVEGARSEPGGYEQAANGFELRLGSEASQDDLVVLETEAGRLVYGLEGAGAVEAVTSSEEPNRLTFPGVFPDVDLELVSVPEGVKDELILHSAEVPDRFVFPLAGTSLTPVVDEETGELVWLDAEGEVALISPAGWMKEMGGLAGDGAFSEGVTYELEGAGDEMALVLQLDRAWLDDPERQFPVLVDPTVQVTSTSPAYLSADTYYREGSATNYVNDTALITGRSSYRYHAFLQFGFHNQQPGTMTPGDGAHPIVSSTLTLSQEHSRNCQQPVFVKPVTKIWYLHPSLHVHPNFGPAYASLPEYPATLPSTSTCPSGGTLRGAVNFNVTGLVSEFEDGSRNNYGMAVVTSHINDQTYRWFRSKEWTTASQRPKLTVVWRNQVPNVPILRSPAAELSAVTAPSELKASYTDLDGDWGNVQFALEKVELNGARTQVIAPTQVGPYESGDVSLSLPTLAEGRYQWRARAFDGSSWSAWSGWRTFYKAGPPGLAELVSPAAGGAVSDSARPTFAATYRQPDAVPGSVYFQVRSQGSTTVIAQGSSPTVAASAQATWTAPSVLATGLYEYRAQGRNVAGNGAWTGWRKFQAGQVPAQPAAVSAVRHGEDRLDVTFSAPPAGTVAKLVVSRDSSAAGIDWSNVAAVQGATPAGAGQLTYRSAPLATGQWYAHVVHANTLGAGTARSAGPVEIVSRAEYLGWDAYAAWSGGINASLSNYVRTDTDLEVEAIGHPLTLKRTYNSRSGRDGWFGLGWSSSFEMNVEAFDGWAVVMWPDGRNEVHERIAPTANPADEQYEPPKGYFSELSREGTGWKVIDRDQTRYVFNAAGKLTSIQTRQGHQTTIAHNSGNVTVTDQVSGRSIKLTMAGARVRQAVALRPGTSAAQATVDYRYGGDPTPDPEAPCHRLNPVSNPTGQLNRVFDARDEAGRLGGCWSFTYDEGRLNTVTTPAGKLREKLVYKDGAVVERHVPKATPLPQPGMEPAKLTEDKDEDEDWEITEWEHDPVSGSDLTVATTTDPRGKKTFQHYDAEFRVVEEIDAAGGVTTHTYHGDNATSPSGLRATTTDPTGVITSWDYTPRGNIEKTTTTSPAGDSLVASAAAEHATFDGTNLPTATWITGTGDGGGKLEHIENRYDTAGNLTAELTQPTTDRPAGTCTHTTYTTGTEPAVGGGVVPANLPKARYGPDQVNINGSGSNRSCAPKPGAVATTFAYRSNGDVAEETDAAGLKTVYGYDGMGRTTSKTTYPELYPSGLLTKFEYDGAGNLIKTEHPAVEHVGLSPKVHQARELTKIDMDGLVIEERVQDAQENDIPRVTEHEYDDAGRKLWTIDPAGGTEEYGYDASGNLIQTKDAQGRLFHTSFNSRNLEETTVLTNFVDGHGADPVTRIIEHRDYDAAGRKETSTDARGIITRTTYDALDRERRTTVTNYRDDVGLGSARTVVVADVELNAAGHRTRSQQGTGVRNQRVETFQVAPDGRTMVATITGGDGGTRTATYGYDPAGRVTSEARTGPDGRGGQRTEQTTREFDAAGRMRSETVENGTVDLTTAFTWYRDGNLASKTSPRWTAEHGATTATRSRFQTLYTYDQAGRQRTEIGPVVPISQQGQAPANGRPETATAYNTFGDTIRERDARGHTTSHTYDTMSRRTSTTAPSYTPPGGGSTITPVESWEYDLVGNRTRHLSRRGMETTTVYDSLNRAAREEAPGPDASTPAVTTWSYDLVGNKTATLDPEGGLNTATHDALGRIRTETAWSTATSPGQRPPTSVAGPRSILEHTHDDLGGLTASRRLDWPATGTPAVTWRQTMTVDSLGQTTSTTDAAGNQWTTSYDLAGRPTVETDPADPGQTAGRSTLAVYDLAGRQVRTQHRGPTGQLVLTSGSEFDADGNQSGRISPGGFDTSGNRTSGYRLTIAHDGSGRPTQSVQDVGTDADGQPVAAITEEYRHDATGNPTGRLDGRGNLFVTSYQPWNLPEQVIEPAVTPAQDGTWTTGYDAGGLAVNETHPGGIDITRTFNPQGRITSEAGTSPSALEPDATRTFGYDRTARTKTVSHPDGQIEFDYDGQGRLTTTTTPGLGTHLRSYDPAGRMTGRRDGPTAGLTTFTYETTDRLKQITTAGGAGVQAIEYYPDGKVRTHTMGSKVQTFGYDDAGRQSVNRLVDDGSSPAQTWFETLTSYDDDSQVHEVQYHLPTATPGTTLPVAANLAAGTHTFYHDQAGRTLKWDQPGATVERYGWDASHNRTRAGASNFAYDARNRITAGPAGLADGPQIPGLGLYAFRPRGTAVLAGSEVMTHDALGRQVSQTGLSTSYDGLDRPAKVSLATGQLATLVDQFVDEVSTGGTSGLLGGQLDALAAQLGAGTVTDQLNATVTDLDITGSLNPVLPGGASGLLDGTQLFTMSYNGPELDPAQDGISEYTRRPDGQLTAVDPDGSGTLAGQAWVGTNPHRDVQWTYEPSRGMTSTAIYGPFGTKAGVTAQPLGTTRAGFQGDWTDPISGQVHMGARWYRPSSATFTARDTYEGELTNPVTRNRYLYGNGSPLRHWDPDGRCASDLGMAKMVGTCNQMAQTHKKQQEQAGLRKMHQARVNASGNGSNRVREHNQAQAQRLSEARSLGAASQRAIDTFKYGAGHRFDPCRARLGRRCSQLGIDLEIEVRHVMGLLYGAADTFFQTIEGVLTTVLAAGSCAVDPRGCATNVSGFISHARDNPGEVATTLWDGLTADVRDAWKAGDYGEAAGRATAMLGGLAVAAPAKAPAAAAQAGTVKVTRAAPRLTDDALRAADDAFSHGYRYDPRIKARGLQDPVGHNFPYSYDDVILQSNPIRQADGSLLYRTPGSINSKGGFFEIAVNPETGTIFHRTFVGGR